MSTPWHRWARKLAKAYGIELKDRDKVVELASKILSKYYIVEKVAKNKYRLRVRVDAVVADVVKYVLNTAHELYIDPIYYAYSKATERYIRYLLPFSPDHEIREIHRIVIEKVKEKVSSSP